MRNTVIWSFLSLVALASGGLITGCDSDDAIAKSAAGESCAKTSDCADGLKCLQGTCYQASSSGGSSNEGGDGSGGTVVGPTPPVLGGEGETCTKRADCEDGLSCISSRCTADGGGEGGSGSGPRLGAPGETCVTSSDCTKGLACIPGGYPFEGVSTGVGFVGICTVPTTFTPSGKTCGAECREAADCCELPVGRHAAIGASSCAALVEKIGNVKTACKAPTVQALKDQCFAYATYCDCADDAWSCDAGRCSYQGECTADTVADVPGGCPSLSRAGNSLTITCNEDGACAPPPTEAACKKDADCETKDVTNDPTGAVAPKCAADECVCHVDSGACYRKCDADLDCASGYNCDADTSICVKAPQCTTNEQCFNGATGLNGVCNEGACKYSCNSNLDCLAGVPTAAVAPEGTLICGPDHFCAPIGCSSDDQCAGAGTVKLFCTETAGPGDAVVYQSAITD